MPPRIFMAHARHTFPLMLMLTITLVGCASTTTPNVRTSPPATTATPTPPSAPTTLRVVRFSGPNSKEVAALDKTQTDPIKVQRLYAAALALPPRVLALSCGLDLGGGELLTFSAGGVILMQAIFLWSGCRWLGLTVPNGCRQLSPAFLQQLADTIGISLEDLAPRAHSAGSGPVAPVEPPGPLLPFSSCFRPDATPTATAAP